MRSTAIAAALALLPIPAVADTLVDNVNGITLDEQGKVLSFKGLVVGDDGKVKQVLRGNDKLPKRPQYRVDGKGRTLLPGMIDSHVHLFGYGFSQLDLDLRDTSSLADALSRIAAYSAAHPDRRVLYGFGWNQEAWGLGRFPTAAELDAATGGRPTILARIDEHAVWANSAALSAAGVTAATADPAGGRIERGAGGKPAGVLVDNAQSLVTRLIPPPIPSDMDLALNKAQLGLLAQGVTAVSAMNLTIEDWQALRRAGDEHRLALRVFGYADGTDAASLIAGSGPTPWLYDDRLRLVGVKLVLDGALGSRGAWLKAPYADAPGRGTARLTDTQLKNLMSRAAMSRFQLAVHAIGDEANATVLDAIDELSQTYKGDRRWRIEHAQVVDPRDMPRFTGKGIVASMQPVHQTSDRLMAEARLGPARLAGAYAWRSLASAGARLAFGSDAPVEVPAPFIGMAAAISRVGADGQPVGGWQPQETVDRTAALAGYTTGAAYAAFADDRVGRLAPGFRADFILVDRDPTVSSPADLQRTRVLETWINGRRVWPADDVKPSPVPSAPAAGR